ncbi:DUF4349 domain-containing protein [Lysobacter tyrosinilyticus]
MRTWLAAGLLVCGGVLALGACSKRSNEPVEAMSEQTAADAAPAAAPAAPEALRSRAATGGAKAEPDVATQLQSAATTQDDGERKFIRTATVDFQVRGVYRAALAIEDLAAQHGGFVVRNNIRTEIDDVETRSSGAGNLIELTTYTMHGDLQVRVPSARTQAFLRALASQAEFLNSRDFSAVDAQFELLRQQLAYARHQDAQQALGQVAQERGKLGDKADAIQARTDSQSERDEALIAQKTFEDRVAFATIDLSLHQSPQVRRTERPDVEEIVRREGPGFFARLGHAISTGWYGLLDAAIALTQLWALWLVLTVVVIAVRRWRRR